MWVCFLQPFLKWKVIPAKWVHYCGHTCWSKEILKFSLVSFAWTQFWKKSVKNLLKQHYIFWTWTKKKLKRQLTADKHNWNNQVRENKGEDLSEDIYRKYCMHISKVKWLGHAIWMGNRMLWNDQMKGDTDRRGTVWRWIQNERIWGNRSDNLQ